MTSRSALMPYMPLWMLRLPTRMNTCASQLRTVAMAGRLILGATIDIYLDTRFIHVQGNLILLNGNLYYKLQPEWWETPIMVKDNNIAL
jgi:hypothetical protein